MPDPARETRLRATRMGPFAAHTLLDGRRGRVHSVFRRSAYLCIHDQLICLGPPALGDGALNLLCQPWPREERAALEVDAPVRVERQFLHVGHSLAVSLAGTEVWIPKPVAEWEQRRLALGLAALAEALPKAPLEEGLACLLLTGCESLGDSPAVPAALRRAAANFGRLVANAMAEGSYSGGADPIAPLIGLGPGLTPSGDDFLGGALVALSSLGLDALRDCLWQAVQPRVAALTNGISGAHLAAAGAGFGSGALHQLLNAVIAGEVKSVPGHIKAVASIGHTSGLDALAGAATVLRAASMQAAARAQHSGNTAEQAGTARSSSTCTCC